MAIKSLEELIAAGKESAVKSFRQNGQLYPVVFVHDKVTDGIAAFNFKAADYAHEERLKHAVVMTVGQLRRTGRFGGALIQSEAWKADARDIPEGKRPEHSPKRVEQIVLVAYDQLGNMRMCSCDINRAGDVVEFGAWKQFDGEFKCWFDLAFSDAEKILASK